MGCNPLNQTTYILRAHPPSTEWRLELTNQNQPTNQKNPCQGPATPSWTLERSEPPKSNQLHPTLEHLPISLHLQFGRRSFLSRKWYPPVSLAPPPVKLLRNFSEHNKRTTYSVSPKTSRKYWPIIFTPIIGVELSPKKPFWKMPFYRVYNSIWAKMELEKKWTPQYRFC